MTDHHSAISMIERMSPSSDFMWFTSMPGVPSGNSRASFHRRGGTLVPSDKREPIREHLKSLSPTPIIGNVCLGCIFFRPNQQRIDADNMLKRISDAATGILWLDDSQITCVMASVELDRVNPRTVIIVGRHASSMKRDIGSYITCEECGLLFEKKSSKRRILCS